MGLVRGDAAGVGDDLMPWKLGVRVLLGIVGTIISVIVVMGIAAWLHEWGVF